MATYVMRKGKIIDKAKAEPLSYGSSLYVITDEMAPLRNMADGKNYTSKAKFRATTKAYGCIEVGNDSQAVKTRQPIQLSREKRRMDIRRAISELGG